MKTCRFIILLLAFFLLLLQGCQPEPPSNTAVSVLCDVSEKAFNDSALYKKDIAALAGLVARNPLKTGDGGGCLRLSALNALSQNTVHTATLPVSDADVLGPNPYVRQDEVQQFEKEVRDGFDAFCRIYSKDADHSKIYQGLCNELTRLASDPAEHRIMAVYSDFLENSALFSLYPPDNIQCLNDPVQFADSTLSRICPLPALNGITIYLVAYRNEKNDDMVNQALRFWKVILEHRGATVNIGADLNSML